MKTFVSESRKMPPGSTVSFFFQILTFLPVSGLVLLTEFFSYYLPLFTITLIPNTYTRIATPVESAMLAV